MALHLMPARSRNFSEVMGPTPWKCSLMKSFMFLVLVVAISLLTVSTSTPWGWGFTDSGRGGSLSVPRSNLYSLPRGST